MHDYKYDITKLKMDTTIEMNLLNLKIQHLLKQNKGEIFKRGISELVLYDDGNHDDGWANDGLYANFFNDTKVPGDYTFRFVAENIPSGDGKLTTREWTKSFNNQVNIKQRKSIVNFNQISSSADKTLYYIRVVPKDTYGNFLGPGFPVTVNFKTTQGEKEIILDDNIDGIYSKKVSFSREISRYPNFTVSVHKEDFFYSNVLPKWGVSIHSGVSIPTGIFANNYIQGFCGIIDIKRKLNQNLSLASYLGYNDFKTNNSTLIDNYWLNLNLNIHYRAPIHPVRYFNIFYYIQAGPGFYIPESGSKAFGSNLGIGLEYDISNNITFVLGADYHILFGKDVQFTQTHGGIIFRF
jgi:hypothetical protein